jgi:hypothetical protein
MRCLQEKVKGAVRGRSKRAIVRLGGLLLALLSPSLTWAQSEEPTKWEQLFFPFPIVGAPPQLEQPVQIFNSYFRGNAGSGDVPLAELAYIASPHIGLVATVPFQIGFGGKTTGFEDAQLLVQWNLPGAIAVTNAFLRIVNGSSGRVRW